MTLGNTVALLQENLKRLLAYSSIAHAGYLMIGVAVAFAQRRHGDWRLPRRRGHPVLPGRLRPDDPGRVRRDHRSEHARAAGRDGRRPGRPGADAPGPALAMALCLFSLAGIPPLAGFWGKFELFASAFAVPSGRGREHVPVAGGDRRAQLGDRRVLLPADRRGDVPPPRHDAARHASAWPTMLAVSTCATLSLLVGLYPPPSPAPPARRRGRDRAPDPILEPVAQVGFRN